MQTNTALITGGSQGLGYALARSLGHNGYRVALVARNREKLELARASLEQDGIEARVIQADVGDISQTHHIAAQAFSYFEKIDLLVNNASSLGPLPMGKLADTSPEEFANLLNINLLGPHALTRALGGNMLLRKTGTILNISSDAAIEAYPGWGPYGVSKAALDHMTRIWAQESSLRFLSVDPSEMDTQMHADALPESDPSTLNSPHKVADAIVQLLEDDRLISGSRHSISL